MNVLVYIPEGLDALAGQDERGDVQGFLGEQRGLPEQRLLFRGPHH